LSGHIVEKVALSASLPLEAVHFFHFIFIASFRQYRGWWNCVCCCLCLSIHTLGKCMLDMLLAYTENVIWES